MAKVRHRSYKNFSGPAIIGTWQIPAPHSSLYCLDRQHWLTTEVETGGTYGTVVMYDGTGITAGPDQFILVYPRALAHEDYNAANDQGPLTKLLRQLEPVPGLASEVGALWKLFADQGWYISRDGYMRYLESRVVHIGTRKLKVTAGDKVHGTLIRDTVTPVKGKVPKKGSNWETALKFGTCVHDLFANPQGFPTQNLFGQERMLKTYTRLRVGMANVSEAVYERVSPSAVLLSDIGQELDLAMAVWYSNSVNAPAIAIKVLRSCIYARKPSPSEDPAGFAKRLIRSLGVRKYGRWNASIPGGRYQRTRKIAMKSGLWDKSLFAASGIMPVKL